MAVKRYLFHRCNGDGCTRAVRERWLMCQRCWDKVPPALQRALYAEYDASGRTKKYLALAREAIRATSTGNDLDLFERRDGGGGSGSGRTDSGTAPSAGSGDLGLPPVMSAMAGDAIPKRLRESGHFGDIVVNGCVVGKTVGYICITCGDFIVNETNLRFHIEGGAVHVVARICEFHQAETFEPEGALARELA